MATLIHLPPAFPDDVANRSKAIAAVLQDWLLDPTPLVAPPERPACERVAISLPASLEARLMAASTGLSTNKAVTAILYTRLSVPTTEKPVAAEPVRYANGRTMAAQQAYYYQAIRQALETRKAPIILAEGGTGLGKSMVLSVLALEEMHAGRHALVAAPTLQVLGQIRNEFIGQLPGAVPPIYLGRAQFVCRQRIEAWLAEDEGLACADADRIRSWLACGGSSSGMGQPSVVAQLLPGVPYLLDDLHYVAPAAPVEQFGLDDTQCDEADAGQAVYARHRERMQADIPRAEASTMPVFATHAALIWDARLQFQGYPRMLPDVDTLLMDEAHQFHTAAEAAFSSNVALRTLVWSLKEKAVWAKLKAVRLAAAAARLVEELMAHIKQDKALRALLNGANNLRLTKEVLHETHMTTHLRLLHQALTALPGNHPVISETLRTISCALGDKYLTELRVSGVRQYPSLSVGPKHLKFFFDPFWQRFNSVLLASGTLYLPLQEGGLSHAQFSLPLSLPSDRLVALRPVHAEWSKAFELRIVPADRKDLAPPSEDAEDNAESAWHAAVAKEIAATAATAAGGVVCLLTGYRHLSEIGAGLAPLLPPETILIIQARAGFRKALQQFMDARRQGGPAVWLATGPAWVGMDLGDPAQPAAEDWLFTDLVIPRIPYGTVHTAAHQRRMEWMQTAERDRAAMQLRQGIGRLMRRPGLLKRRLTFLDARLHYPTKAWLMRPVKLIFRQYAP